MARIIALGVVVLLAASIASGVVRFETSLRAAGQEPKAPVVFEVAAVRQNKSGQIAAQIDDLPGGRFIATNATARMLIREAYRIPINSSLTHRTGRKVSVSMSTPSSNGRRRSFVAMLVDDNWPFDRSWQSASSSWCTVRRGRSRCMPS